jgi:hypothetical protein
MFNNFEKIGEEIYVYKNFLSEKECNNIVNVLEAMPEEEWVFDRPEIKHKRTEPLEEILNVRSKLNKLIPEGLFLGMASTATRLVTGDSWGEHSDVHDFAEIDKIANSYIEGMPYVEKELSVYGTVVYFNEFEGGQIYYPTQNIVYAPKPGDLVIHSSAPLCLHGVKPVISEKRYSYSNHIYKNIKVPV